MSMGRLVVVVPLKEGNEARARELLVGGPPFDPEGTAFDRHAVHLTGREAVFVFEGSGPSATLELTVRKPTCGARRKRGANASRSSLEWLVLSSPGSE
jgi:hypothetical protein